MNILTTLQTNSVLLLDSDAAIQVRRLQRHRQHVVFSRHTSHDLPRYLEARLQLVQLPSSVQAQLKARLESIYSRVAPFELPLARTRVSSLQSSQVTALCQSEVVVRPPRRVTEQRLRQLRIDSRDRRVRRLKLIQQLDRYQTIERDYELEQMGLQENRLRSQRAALRLRTQREQRKQQSRTRDSAVQEENQALKQRLDKYCRKAETKVKLRQPEGSATQRVRTLESKSLREELQQFQRKYIERKRAAIMRRSEAGQLNTVREEEQNYYRGRIHDLLKEKQKEESLLRKREAQLKATRISRARVYSKLLLEECKQIRNSIGEINRQTTCASKAQTLSDEERAVKHRLKLHQLGDNYLAHLKNTRKPVKYSVPSTFATKDVVAVVPKKKDYLQRQKRSHCPRIKIESLDRVGFERFMARAEVLDQRAVRLQKVARYRQQWKDERGPEDASDLVIASIESKLAVLQQMN